MSVVLFTWCWFFLEEKLHPKSLLSHLGVRVCLHHRLHLLCLDPPVWCDVEGVCGGFRLVCSSQEPKVESDGLVGRPIVCRRESLEGVRVQIHRRGGDPGSRQPPAHGSLDVMIVVRWIQDLLGVGVGVSVGVEKHLRRIIVLVAKPLGNLWFEDDVGWLVSELVWFHDDGVLDG